MDWGWAGERRDDTEIIVIARRCLSAEAISSSIWDCFGAKNAPRNDGMVLPYAILTAWQKLNQ